jgi:hypothetical protein
MTNAHSDRGDRLVSEIISDPDDASRKGVVNDLLMEFNRGYSLENLKALMRHENHSVAAIGAWIASELPDAAPELLNDAVALLAHPDRKVRFYALGVVRLADGGERNRQYIHLIKALEDRDSAVSKQALFLLSRIGEVGHLATARQHFESREPTSFHSKGLNILADARSASSDDVQGLLKSPDPLQRKYGLAVAERLYGDHPELLDLAEMNVDQDIGGLAKDMKRLHTVREKGDRRRNQE